MKESIKFHAMNQIHYDFFDQNIKNIFDLHQFYFDNILYQRNDFIEVCRMLNIPSLQVLRMPGMALTFPLSREA